MLLAGVALPEVASWFGWNWLKQAEQSGHPFMRALYQSPESLYEATELVELISYLRKHAGEEAFREVVSEFQTLPRSPKHIKTLPIRMRTMLEELRVYRSFRLASQEVTWNIAGCDKSPDLTWYLGDHIINVEVTTLNKSHAEERTQAFLEHLVSKRDEYSDVLQMSFLQTGELKQKELWPLKRLIDKRIQEAIRDGVSVIDNHHRLRAVIWQPHESERAKKLHQELDLEAGYLGSTFGHLTILPKRLSTKVIEKADQANEQFWLLVVGTKLGITDTYQLKDIVDRIQPRLSQHPELLGCVLYDVCSKVSEQAEKLVLEEGRLLVTESVGQMPQQTLFLKNKACWLPDSESVWEVFYNIAEKQHWGEPSHRELHSCVRSYPLATLPELRRTEDKWNPISSQALGSKSVQPLLWNGT